MQMPTTEAVIVTPITINIINSKVVVVVVEDMVGWIVVEAQSSRPSMRGEIAAMLPRLPQGTPSRMFPAARTCSEGTPGVEVVVRVGMEAGVGVEVGAVL